MMVVTVVVVALVRYCIYLLSCGVVTVFVRVAFVIVVGELLLSGCSVMVIGGVLVGVVVIVGYFGDGGKVVVLMFYIFQDISPLMMTNVRLPVVIRKNKFIYMLHGFVCGVGSGGGVNSGCGSFCLAHHHHHQHTTPTTTTKYTLDLEL